MTLTFSFFSVSCLAWTTRPDDERPITEARPPIENFANFMKAIFVFVVFIRPTNKSNYYFSFIISMFTRLQTGCRKHHSASKSDKI